MRADVQEGCAIALRGRGCAGGLRGRAARTHKAHTGFDLRGSRIAGGTTSPLRSSTQPQMTTIAQKRSGAMHASCHAPCPPMPCPASATRLGSPPSSAIAMSTSDIADSAWLRQSRLAATGTSTMCSIVAANAGSFSGNCVVRPGFVHPAALLMPPMPCRKSITGCDLGVDVQQGGRNSSQVEPSAAMSASDTRPTAGASRGLFMRPTMGLQGAASTPCHQE